MKALLLTTMIMRSSPSGMALKPAGKNVFVIRRLTKRWSRRHSRRSRSRARLIVKPLGRRIMNRLKIGLTSSLSATS